MSGAGVVEQRVRTGLVFDPELKARLKARAAIERIDASDLLNRLLDQGLNALDRESKARTRRRVGLTADSIR